MFRTINLVYCLIIRTAITFRYGDVQSLSFCRTASVTVIIIIPIVSKIRSSGGGGGGWKLIFGIVQVERHLPFQAADVAAAETVAQLVHLKYKVYQFFVFVSLLVEAGTLFGQKVLHLSKNKFSSSENVFCKITRYSI